MHRSSFVTLIFHYIYFTWDWKEIFFRNVQYLQQYKNEVFVVTYLRTYPLSLTWDEPYVELERALHRHTGPLHLRSTADRNPRQTTATEPGKKSKLFFLALLYYSWTRIKD